MARVVDSALIARLAERLAGRAARPDFSLSVPLGETERSAPSSEPCEEVALLEPVEVFGLNMSNVSGIDIPGRYLASLNQGAEPRCRVGLALVVVRATAHALGRITVNALARA